MDSNLESHYSFTPNRKIFIFNYVSSDAFEIRRNDNKKKTENVKEDDWKENRKLQPFCLTCFILIDGFRVTLTKTSNWALGMVFEMDEEGMHI